MNLTTGKENFIKAESKKYLSEIYTEMNTLNAANDVYYSLALYRCLVAIDYYVSQDNLSELISILEAYSLLFNDKYVFGMLQMVVSLNSGMLK